MYDQAILGLSLNYVSGWNPTRNSKDSYVSKCIQMSLAKQFTLCNKNDFASILSMSNQAIFGLLIQYISGWVPFSLPFFWLFAAFWWPHQDIMS